MSVVPLSSFTEEKLNELLSKLVIEKIRRGTVSSADDENKKQIIAKMDAIDKRLANIELAMAQAAVTSGPKNSYGESHEEKAQRKPITCPCCGKVTKPNNPKQEKCWTCLNAEK